MEEIKEPKFFNVPERSDILGISQSEGYILVKSPDCPFMVIRIGKRICISANGFYKWYESLANDSAVENGNAEK